MKSPKHHHRRYVKPRKLPSCWWVVAEFDDKSVDLISPREDRSEALQQAAYWNEQSSEWIKKPKKIYLEVDSLQLHRKQRPDPIGLQWTVGARWDWFQRNRNLLTSRLKPKLCRVLTRGKGEGAANPTDLLTNRIGGQAVLPNGRIWPTFTVKHWPKGKMRKEKVLGAYVGTFDLRGFFTWQGFPQAISIFLCTYDSWSRKHGYFATCPVGRIVPLYSSEPLTLAPAPKGGIEVTPSLVQVWEMPDFPPIVSSNEDALDNSPAGRKRHDEIETVYRKVERLEPGTSRWIYLECDKIGGYTNFIQNDLVIALARRQPTTRWQVIASYAGDEIGLGDAGVLYVLAGWDTHSKKWKWHCEWQCH